MSALNVMADELNSIGVPYEFMRWTSTVDGQYWVGEYSEIITDSEDGYNEYSFILTGTTRGSWLELEQTKDKIKSHFPDVYGLRKSTDDGTVAIFYEQAFPVDTGEAELKRIQVNLRIKEWKGAI